MEQQESYQKDLESIRKLMERSVKFISLSGLSGILSGVYALIGATIAYYLVHYPASPFTYQVYSMQSQEVVIQLMVVAAVVLASSILTGIWLSSKKAKRAGIKIWDTTSKRLFINLSVPLITGGIFVLILLSNGYFGIVAPACLIFYGLALINASANLFEEVRYLGYSEIVLGLMAAAMPGYGLVFWAVGFGLLHIIYGSVMYKRYDS
jgi:predicted lysophospholipase L1 biosynthesis ABC-type transport system permease subunit